MDGRCSSRRVLAAVALLAVSSVLAACSGSSQPAGEPMPHVAAFRLGSGAVDEQEYVLAPVAAPRVDSREEQQSPPTTPRAPEQGSAFVPTVAWVNDGRYLGVMTWGSGSCPSVPYEIRGVADQEIEVRLGELHPDAEICTADVSGFVTVVEVPDGVAPTRPLTVRFDENEVILEPVGT